MFFCLGLQILYFINSEIGCHCYRLNFGLWQLLMNLIVSFVVEMQNMLQKWFEESHSRFWDQNPKSHDSEDFGNTDVKIPYQLWNIGKYGTCAEAAITGIMPPPLMEQQQVNYSLK